MDILITDPTRFGLMPNGKRIMPNSNGIYLITNGTAPNQATKAILCAEPSYVRPNQIKDTEKARQYLDTNQTTIWNINCIESKRTKTVVWQICDEQAHDYNVQELAALQAKEKEISWLKGLRTQHTLCDILGISSANYRNLTAKLVEHESKPATRLKPCSIAFFSQALNEFKEANITVSTHEQPNDALHRRMNEIGEGIPDDNGYVIEKVQTKKPEISKITSYPEYVVRYKGERRHNIAEASKGSAGSGFDIGQPILRFHTREGIKHVIHSTLTNSVGLWQVLKIENPDLFESRMNEIDLSNRPLGLTLGDFYGVSTSIHSDPEMLNLIRKLDVEALTLNSTWEKIDLTVHAPLIKNLGVELDLSDKEAYSLEDSRLAKSNYCLRTFGFKGYSSYFVHPLTHRHTPIRKEPKDYYWMKWCLANDVTFKNIEAI